MTEVVLFNLSVTYLSPIIFLLLRDPLHSKNVFIYILFMYETRRSSPNELLDWGLQCLVMTEKVDIILTSLLKMLGDA